MSNNKIIQLENDWKETTTSANELMETAKEKALLKYHEYLQKAEILMEYLERCISLKVQAMLFSLFPVINWQRLTAKCTNGKSRKNTEKRGLFHTLFKRQGFTRISARLILDKWLFKQMLLYNDYTQRSEQPEKFRILLQHIKN